MESSSNELSSPPGSPEMAAPSSSTLTHSNNGHLPLPLGVASSEAPTAAPANTTTSQANQPPPATTTTTTKRTRKKQQNGEEKPKTTRKPRAPKDPNAPPTQRKKRKTADDDKSAQPQQSSAAAHKQSKITDLVAPTPDPIPNPALTHLAAHSSVPRPASSGQLYDPIRSSTVPASQHSHASSMPPVSPPARVVNRASASPSINSLIDPPSVPSQSHLSQQSRFQPPMSVTSAPASPAPPPAKQNPFGPPTETAQSSKPPPMTASPMEGIEQTESSTKSAPTVKKESTASTPASSAPASTAPPKASKQKEAPPLPSGSGLLAGMPLGGAPSNKPNEEGTNIWLTFPLKGQNNVTINFAREVEKKYGFAALHPRVAAAKERRRQMAAATAALEKGSAGGSADDMSVDLSENESNVEMGGAEEDLTLDGKKRQRKKKVEDYDKDDDFIDDTELAWEQSALMAKDGFFVYSGPLLNEGEKPTIERADGTVARGRGRGRGRGGTTRGDAASGRGSRGGGRGSRGGMTTRKPRVTKADRAMMEQEKLEREKIAAGLANAKPAIQRAPYMT
ncbi:hypothetical protein IWX49DRAFT_420892 [Phyllosticta citricarpa]|uniref:Hpc2-related domain-containing protein n=2 Tax=Phyllosticta TaxID=121621 RepID=A0ABR1MFT2_9PEZI